MGNKPLLYLPDAKFSDHLHHYFLSYAFPQLLKFYDSGTVDFLSLSSRVDLKLAGELRVGTANSVQYWNRRTSRVEGTHNSKSSDVDDLKI